MDDRALQHGVIQELEWARHVDPDDIRVSVDEGVVKLSGSVGSEGEKKAVERAVWHVKGVRALVLDLLIRDENDAWHSDESIAHGVVAALGDRCTPAGQIRVKVESGVVWLAGMVEGPSQSAEAETLSRGVPGVLGVENRLSLRPLPGSSTPGASTVDDRAPAAA
jgi:osmotically-inducible protein OsmY